MPVSVVTFNSVFVYVNILTPNVFMCVLSGGFTVSDIEWNFYIILGCFRDLNVPVVNCPMVLNYHPSVVVKFS